jgi:nitrate reductase NapA
MKTGRRQFFRQVFSAGAVGALVTGCEKKSPGPGAGGASLSPEEFRRKLLAGATATKAVCRFCGTGCGVIVYAREGKIVATEGDPKTRVNQGLNCIKGYHLAHIQYGKDRLRQPQVRKQGKLVEVSWEEALDLVAGKIKEALAEGGPSQVAIAGSGQWTIHEGYVAAKYFKAGLKSNNIDPNARFCMASAVMGFMTTFGSDEPMGNYEDLDVADVFVTWGANMAEQHPILFSRLLARKQSAGGVELWDLGTRFTRTSEEATEYLEFEPNTDLAIANALAHVIVKEKLYDREFIDQNVIFKRGPTDIGYGLDKHSAPHLTNKEWDGPPAPGAPQATDALPATFADYEAFLEDYSPETVAALSGVPAEKLRRLARLYGDPRRRVMSLWTMGVNQHTRGTWMNNLIYNLHLLTGKIATPGNSPFSLTGQPSACGTAREVGTFAHRLPADMLVTDPEHRRIAAKIWLGDENKADQIPDQIGLHLTLMLRAFERGKLRFLWVSCNNPFAAAPNLNRLRDRRHNPRGFLVVSDVYPNASTELADVVLPSAMWVEKEGGYGNAERRTQLWKPAVPPPPGVNAKPDVEQLIEVAQRTGHGSLFPYPKETLYRDLWEEYRQFGLGRTKDLAPYEWYHARHGGGRWPVVRDETTGEWKETPYRYNAAYDPYAAQILGKKEGICFYKKKWLKPGASKDSRNPNDYEYRAVVWLRPYQPPPEVPDKEFRSRALAEAPPDKYPFWLCTGRVLEHWHTGTMTRRVAALHRAVPEAVCEMHPDDAQSLGLRTGQPVRVKTRRGELVLKLETRGRSKPARGSIFIPFFDEARAVNLLTLDAYCPISKEPDFKKCAARVEPA